MSREGLDLTRQLWLLLAGGWQGPGWRQADPLGRPQPSHPGPGGVVSGPPQHLFSLSSPVCSALGIISNKHPPPTTTTAAAGALFHTWNHMWSPGPPHLCPCCELCQDRPSGPAQMSPHRHSLPFSPVAPALSPSRGHTCLFFET